MLADYHLHSKYSPDSNVDVDKYVEKALELGFDEICYTDHYDFDEPRFNSINFDKYFEDIKTLKEKFKNKINVKIGMEFGMQIHIIEKFKKIYNLYPFDFIILSCHSIDDLQLYNGEFQKGKTQKDFNERYYNEIYNIISVYKDYSVLGHLDLIRRYDKTYYSLEKTKPIITKILKQVIKDGKGIEVNTSCYRYNIPDLTPSLDIIDLYKELGGEIITIGSDSHDITHFGAKIKDVQKILIEHGYKYFYTFDKMTPKRHDLCVFDN